MNAKNEFLKHTANRSVKCAIIHTQISARLKIGFTPEEYDLFLKTLDVEYNEGYGGQELYGTIWYVDGTWSERGEYDGKEWWNYKYTPLIPEELNR